MAVSFLRLTDSAFWAMCPVTLLAMIDEYNDINKCNYSTARYINSGGEIELERDRKRKIADEYKRYSDPFLM